MSNPSRFDSKKLLSGNGGSFFNVECLKEVCDITVMNCDIRVKEDKSPLLENTKGIILLGTGAAHEWLPNETKDNTIGEIRGTPYTYNGIPCICTFFPQDAVDPKDFESKFNAQDDEETESDTNDSQDEKRHHGRTSRTNYKFWIKSDLKKLWRIMKFGVKKTIEPVYKIYPDQREILDFLTTTRNTDLFLDIETDAALNITVMALATPTSPIYVIPFLTHQYVRAYAGLPRILCALATCIKENTLVAHNGKNFDFLVIPYKYRIPVGPKLYDTMLAHHRCFPLVEKSLGHCTSYWTHEPFHKDESDFSMSSAESAQRLWAYCGKDVHTMRLIKAEIDLYSQTVPGLADSITQAMESIYPYITIELTGIRYKQEIMDEIMNENDRLMMQYIRCIEILVGKNNLMKIKGKGKSSMPGSNKQCVTYFHTMLDYPVVARSKENAKGERNPSLAKEAMFKLKLKHNNPVIDFCLQYRSLQTESGSLKFIPIPPEISKHEKAY